MIPKIIHGVKSHQYEVFLAFCMLFVGLIGYNLGKIQALKQAPISISNNEAAIYIAGEKNENPEIVSQAAKTQKRRDGKVVVSKKATSKKYHFPDCQGALKIKEENKLWFENEVAAQKAGYTLAGNCTR
ncbi:MAG TPA: hypothetical protein VJJ72_00525 [Candidatus Paceibacterota bacterium]